jgi:hypothetical protein
MMKKICMFLLVGTSIGLAQNAQDSAKDPGSTGSGFTLNISTRESSWNVGRIGTVIVKEKNMTDQLIDTSRPGVPCLWYRMDILRDGVQVQKTEDMLLSEAPPKGPHMGSGPFFSILKPDAVVQFEVPVAQCYDMTVPGSYQITFTWDSDPLHPAKNVQTRSNTITIAVLPTNDPQAKH